MNEIEVMKAPWNEAAPEDHDLRFIHMQHAEVASFMALESALLGDPPKYKPDRQPDGELKGIYIFPRLAVFFDDAGARDWYKKAYYESDENDPNDRQLMALGKSIAPNFKSNPKTESFGAKSLAKVGQGGDDMLVGMPNNLVKVLVELHTPPGEEPATNSVTGLLEFGSTGSKVLSAVVTPIRGVGNAVGRAFGHKNLGNELVRAGFTAAGAIMGGGTGAGIGNILGRMATGQNFNKAILPGIKTGLMVGAAQSIIPSIPGVPGMMGSLAKTYPTMGAMASSAVGTAPNMAAPTFLAPVQSAAQGVNSGVGNLFSSISGIGSGSNAAGTAAAPVATGATAAATEGGGLLSGGKGLMSGIGLGLAGSHFLAAKTARDEQKRMEETRQRMLAEEEEMLQKRGYYRPFEFTPKPKSIRNPHWHGKPGGNAFLTEGTPEYDEAMKLRPQNKRSGGRIKRQKLGLGGAIRQMLEPYQGPAFHPEERGLSGDARAMFRRLEGRPVQQRPSQVTIGTMTDPQPWGHDINVDDLPKADEYHGSQKKTRRHTSTNTPQYSIGNSRNMDVDSIFDKYFPHSIQPRYNRSEPMDDQVDTLIANYFNRPKSKKTAKSMAHGGRIQGAIKGPGKGQADVIRKALEAGDHIIPSDVVSAMGDGTTDQGYKVFNSFVQRHSHGQNVTSPKVKKRNIVQVALSNGEYRIPRSAVIGLGQGSEEHGANLLDGLVKNVRQFKQSHGTDLPPQAGLPEHYL